MNFKNNHIVIYGANGWIGKALLDYLINNNLVPEKNIIAISSSVKNISLQNGKIISCITHQEALQLKLENVIFFHLAFLLRNLVSQMPLEDYIKGNEEIRKNATKLIEHFKPEKIIYTSSGAVYEEDRKISMIIDKNPYGYLKYQDELHFKKLAESISAPLIIPRIFNIAGPYINKLDMYAIASFAAQLMSKKEIVINASNPVIRSYIHIFDLIKILLEWSFKNDEKYFLFDSANIDEIELEELAKLTLEVTNIDGKIIRDFNPYLEKNRYVGDISNQNILTSRYKIKLQTHKDCVTSVFNYIKNNA
jgi:nucleoside-diphosphate-sugar epimerase